ncbi:hypothetical protein LCGC14_2158030 [marine sediment metagenome]|uniref:Uncharacterized protein n=1 Tax=marine sediment metagenome TaxID=412755 RepID=A0A0F9G6E9_9ZZZZ
MTIYHSKLIEALEKTKWGLVYGAITMPSQYIPDLLTIVREHEEQASMIKMLIWGLGHDDIRVLTHPQLAKYMKDKYAIEKVAEITTKEQSLIKMLVEALDTERLAALEHEQWAHWTKYILNNSTPVNVCRWLGQSKVSYGQLSEDEKESDRKWARRINGQVLSHLSFQQIYHFFIGFSSELFRFDAQIIRQSCCQVLNGISEFNYLGFLVLGLGHLRHLSVKEFLGCGDTDIFRISIVHEMLQCSHGLFRDSVQILRGIEDRGFLHLFSEITDIDFIDWRTPDSVDGHLVAIKFSCNLFVLVTHDFHLGDCAVAIIEFFDGSVG